MEHVNPPPPSVQVWKNEEKGSDVNLALHVLNDAWLDAYDCAVIVSNDSDLAESLRLVKSRHSKLIGLVTPGAPARKTSRQLRQYADFVSCQPRAAILGRSAITFERDTGTCDGGATSTRSGPNCLARCNVHSARDTSASTDSPG